MNVRDQDPRVQDTLDSLICDVGLSAAQPAQLPSRVLPCSDRHAYPAVGSLCNFARGDASKPVDETSADHRITIALSGGIETLVALLMPHHGEHVTAKAAEALQHLAVDSNNRHAIGGEPGAIQHLTRMVGEESRSGSHEAAAGCLRNLSLDRSNARAIGKAGAIPALVRMLTAGSGFGRGMAAGTLASLAKDKVYGEQLGPAGAVPRLVALLSHEAELCRLSAVGAMTEIAHKCDQRSLVVRHNGLAPLVALLTSTNGLSYLVIQEKAMCASLEICKSDEYGHELLAVGIGDALVQLLHGGTDKAKEAAAAALVCLEPIIDRSIMMETVEPITDLLSSPKWNLQAVAAKSVMQLYKEDVERMAVVEAGGLEKMEEMLATKSSELNENTVGALLNLAEHRDIPLIIAERGILPTLATTLTSLNETVRAVAIALLQVVVCYDADAVWEAVPRHHRAYVDKEPAETFADFFKVVYEKKKTLDYLKLSAIADEFTEEEIDEFKEQFKQLDADASGSVDAEELGVLMESLGEPQTEKQLKELIEEVDVDGSGEIEFPEFLLVMKNMREGKNTSFGQAFGKALKNGTMGKAFGAALKGVGDWWNKEAIAEAERIERQRLADERAEERQKLAAEWWDSERLKRERDREEAARARQKR